MRAAHLLSLVVVVACNQSDFDTDPNAPSPDGPGTPQWGEPNISCTKDSECNYGESCAAGVCQMKRCGQDTYHSNAPFGDRRTFVQSRQVVVADSTASSGAYWADGYIPNGSTMTYPSGGGSWNAGTGSITDVAGGAFESQGPELVAVARAGSAVVAVPALNKTVNVGFTPVAIAAGDVDHLGVDQLVALGSSGQVAICVVDTGSCTRHDFAGGTTGYDVTVGDVDADGTEEPVFHLSVGSTRLLVVMNLDAATTGQPGLVQIATDPFMGIAAVDLDGNGRAEILGLTDGGWLGFASDVVATFSSNGTALSKVTTTSVASNSIDIAGGDLDGDQHGELLLLTNDRIAHVYRGTPGYLSQAYQGTLAASSTPTKISTVDFSGASTIGHLVSGPVLVPGEAVPTTVMYMPPYYASYSSHASSVAVGSTASNEMTRSDSIGLSVGATVGVGGAIPGIIEGRIGVELTKEATSTHSFTSSVTVTNRFEAEANPTLYGPDVAAVVVSCGCFHEYTYEMQTPGGGNGQQFVVLLPVGGQTMVWSSKRYNAMAKAVGNLPIIPVPMVVGDASSYPHMPQRADGTPIPAEDLVFTHPPSVRVSDIADTVWELSAAHNETNGTAMHTAIEASASVTVVGVEVGASVGVSWEQGYEVTVGSSVELGGIIPSLADNPNTPEDEYTTHAYGFQPTVYRQPYTKGNSTSAAYYVVNYAVPN